jgi:hypothetical protein
MPLQFKYSTSFNSGQLVYCLCCLQTSRNASAVSSIRCCCLPGDQTCYMVVLDTLIEAGNVSTFL